MRDKRLAKANELLGSNMAVKDICYSPGFENVATSHGSSNHRLVIRHQLYDHAKINNLIFR